MSNVHSFDLNLLLAFDALWAERNVTRAARRIGLTQSALSHALSRLRLQLDDPLFRPAPPRGMLPTPKAQALAGPLAEALALIRSAVESPAPFDPRRLRRTFTLATADYGELVILPRLVAAVARAAPEVTLVVRPISMSPERELGAGEHDIAFSLANNVDPSLRSQILFEDGFVCLLRRGHPLAKKRLTLDRYTKLSHVLIAPSGVGEGIVDQALRALGRSRRIAVRTAHFLVAPLAVAESDHIITLPERIVRGALPPSRFAIMRPPVEVPGFSMAAVWHPRHDADPGHAWLREMIRSSVPSRS